MKLKIIASDIYDGERHSMQNCPVHLAYERDNPFVNFKAGAIGIYFDNGTGLRYSNKLSDEVKKYDSGGEFIEGEYEIGDELIDSNKLMMGLDE